jgi:hypothetical protein
MVVAVAWRFGLRGVVALVLGVVLVTSCGGAANYAATWRTDV